MKKGLIGVLSLLFVIFAGSIADAAEPVKILVNGTVIMPDVAPFVVEGRTFVPVRFVAEALGVSVDWDENTSTVIINTGGATNSPTENSTGEIQIFVNGQPISTDIPPRSVNGRVMVPIRFVAEALNCRVGWQGQTNAVTITDKKFTTAHANILPAKGVKQEAIDIIKEYAEKVYLKVGADLEPTNDNFYDIYIYPDHNSFTDGGVEIRKISREEASKGTIFWKMPNIIGIDISNLGPDDGNWLAWAYASLNAWNIAGDRNQLPKWLKEGIGHYEYYLNPLNSLKTRKTYANDRIKALDAAAKEAIHKFSEAPNPVKFSYEYRYAEYIAAKILIDKLGLPKVNELIRDLNSKSDLSAVFQEKTGYSLEDFDYQLTKTLYSDMKQDLKPVSIKVSLNSKGCTDKTYIVLATRFSGSKRFYELKAGKTPGDYYFDINPDGTVSSNSIEFKENKIMAAFLKGNWDAAVIVLAPSEDVDEEYLNFKISYGMLYPNHKVVVKSDVNDSINLTDNLDSAFPDGNTITQDYKNKNESGGIWGKESISERVVVLR